MRHFLNPPGLLQGCHPRYSTNDAVFNVACAWSAVPGHIFSRAWKKLWPAVTFAEGSSSDEEPDGLQVKPHNQTFAHILELGREAPGCPSSRLHRGTATEQSGPGCAAGEDPAPAVGSLELAEKDGDEAAWEQAAASFDAVVRFAEGQPCFTAQEVGQLRTLRSVFVRQRQVKRRRVALRAVVKLETPPEASPLPCSSTAGEH